MDEKEIIEATQEILPLLPKLLGENSNVVEKELKALLRQAESGQEIKRALMRLLRQHEPARHWMENKLTGSSVTDRSYSPLAGDHKPPLPKGDKGNPKPK